MQEMGPLQGKTAIVTGASSGIGQATAELLASKGAHVFLVGRTLGALQALREIISADAGTATIACADINDGHSLANIVEQSIQTTGSLDIMVNNAGLEYPGTIIDGDIEHWRQMVQTNIVALLAGCQAAVKAMRSCGANGHIVNVSSVSAQRSNSGVYGATKHAVNVISSSLRDELEEDDIRVTNVMPGATSTNFARNFPAQFVQQIIAASGLDIDFTPGEHLPAQTLQALAEHLPKMLCQASDVANAVLFAVSQPINVNIAEIVVRPPRAMNLAH
ncbi:MAG: SDR family NAD(P)-dependent oxidoreductase [Proteobacteria bacterium]|nr:SDR family NAD(P)-dependent oxidoreductase [Pseudomonadota bacterium]